MPATLQAYALPRCEPARFARLGAGLLARMEAEPGAEPVLLVAGLTGDAVLLGRHQRLNSALDPAQRAGLPAWRRASGGRALRVGEGRVGVLLGVPEMGAMLEAPLPPAKVLNRYVRGLLAGLTRAGAPGGAHYFGRDFVSAQSRQLAVVGQENGPRAALLEALVAAEQPLLLPRERSAYPEHGDPRVYGPPEATLAELRGSPLGFEELADHLVRGYAQVHGCLSARRGEPDWAEAALPPAEEDEAGWSESGYCDIPIGFAEGLCRHDGERLLEARLRGDFLAPAFVMTGLERALAGAPLTFAELGQRVDAAFHQPGACSLGLSELRVLADAMLAAAGKA